MNAKEHTLKQIANILSFNYPNVSLKEDLLNETFNWEHIVKIGSAQLVIPALYSRLRSKGVLPHLPEELQDYLSYIYNLNKERNTSLLQEVQLISSWFTSAGIEHVFLKGAAMIASGYYEHIGERMLGDIDVLVPRNQCQKAFDLLINKGYTYAKEPTISPKYFEDKHLLRLASKNYIGAVEIHFKLLNKDQKDLNPLDVLKDKQLVTESELPIPSDRHLLIHNVLNFQINDLGFYYNYIGLKNFYDSLVLLPLVEPMALQELQKNKYIAHNFSLGHLYFNTFPKPKTSLKLALHHRIYNFKNHSKTFSFWHYKLLSYLDFSKLVVHRLWFFIKNKNYRRDILKDRARVYDFIKSKL